MVESLLNRVSYWPINPLTRVWLARIIHECRREAAETEARRGFSHVRSDAGGLAVRRGDRTRKAAPGERIGCCSRYS
jgi:hypothetical protein